MNTRINELETRSDLDILFIGSSQVYRGIDPRIFKEADLDVFVLGSSSQTPIQSRTLLERHLDRLSPDIVVMDIFPLTFMDQGVESALDLLANDIIDEHSIAMAIRVSDITVWNTLIYRMFLRSIDHAPKTVEPLVIGSDRYIEGGYVENMNDGYVPRATRELTVWDPPRKQIKAFREMIHLLDRKNIRIVFVHAPVTSQFRYSGNALESYRQQFAPLAEFHDLSDLFGDDTTYFLDQFHLNSKGVRSYNKHLIDILQGNDDPDL